MVLALGWNKHLFFDYIYPPLKGKFYTQRKMRMINKKYRLTLNRPINTLNSSYTSHYVVVISTFDVAKNENAFRAPEHEVLSVPVEPRSREHLLNAIVSLSGSPNTRTDDTWIFSSSQSHGAVYQISQGVLGYKFSVSKRTTTQKDFTSKKYTLENISL